MLKIWVYFKIMVLYVVKIKIILYLFDHYQNKKVEFYIIINIYLNLQQYFILIILNIFNWGFGEEEL